MSTWDTVKKKATSFGVKGFLYGALAGAIFGAVALVAGAGIMYGISLMGILPDVAAGLGSLSTAANTAMAFAQGGGSLLSLAGFGVAVGGGSLAGAAIGGIGGAATGACYAAAADEGNPMPNMMDKVAHKILEKTPNLAHAVAHKVNNQQAATEQLVQTTTKTVEAPALAQQVEPKAQSAAVASSASFQDRVTAQAREPEMAVAQR